jgi:hypothetical protein
VPLLPSSSSSVHPSDSVRHRVRISIHFYRAKNWQKGRPAPLKAAEFLHASSQHKTQRGHRTGIENTSFQGLENGCADSRSGRPAGCHRIKPGDAAGDFRRIVKFILRKLKNALLFAREHLTKHKSFDPISDDWKIFLIFTLQMH